MNERDYLNIVKVPEAGIVSSDIPEIPSRCIERVDGVLIPEDSLRKRINALADQICSDYKEKGIKGIDIVYILEGAFMFASDLEREIFRTEKVEIYSSSSLKASTYRDELKGAGEVRREVKIAYMPEVRGKDVLLVEDIADQGFTLGKVINLIREKGAKSLKVCVLMSKILKNPSDEVKRNHQMFELDYVGFEIPDRWVAGYGTDASGDFRDLPFIVTVNEKHYREKL